MSPLRQVALAPSVSLINAKKETESRHDAAPNFYVGQRSGRLQATNREIRKEYTFPKLEEWISAICNQAETFLNMM